MVTMLKVQHLVLILGRGTGKTTDILAKRTMDICYEMPGAYIAISSDTYMNAVKNVLPSIIEGWERNGWIEDVHFVVGVRPPKNFYPKGYGKPYKPPISWKHTITTFTGNHFKLISQDRPSTGAGDSYQHIIADEVKYQSEQKFNKLSPAMRGDIVRFGHSPYYLGTTITTDMPNPNHGEHDWFLRFEKNMDSERIKVNIYVAHEINKILLDRVHAEQTENSQLLAKCDRDLKRWEAHHKKVRRGSTFFYRASSFINVKMLRLEFFSNILKTMKMPDFLTSILSISPKLEKGLMFYPNLNEMNFFGDSYVYDNLDKSKVREFSIISLDLKYCRSNQPLEAGLDTGKMCSLAIGQPESEAIYRIFKTLHTVTPHWLPELGENFREFFKHHKNKKLKLYHDRDANKMQSVGEDHASKLKKAIEKKKDGTDSGWRVELMSRNQATIYHQTEYELLLQMTASHNPYGLPTLLICRNECGPLKSSMERAKVIVKVNGKGEKTIHKDKSSEKLPDDMLPYFSTNMSDGGKYLLCRPEFLEKIKGSDDSKWGSAGVY